MAPPRRISRQQLEILMDFLEENNDMTKGLPSGGASVSHHTTKQKWSSLSKQLNAVHGGALKTPDGWKKYWFEWRHKCKRKAADVRRFQSGPDGGPNRFVPLNDLEVRVLELSGKETVKMPAHLSKQQKKFLSEDSDSEQPLESLKNQVASNSVTKHNVRTGSPADDNTRPSTPPPSWALELEQRRIAADERMADALESMSSIMRTREERRAMLDERIADAFTAIAGTLQDLNSGIQEAVQHLQRLQPVQSNGPDLKDDVFL